jgi:hypothetical protein
MIYIEGSMEQLKFLQGRFLAHFIQLGGQGYELARYNSYLVVRNNT